MVWYDMAWNGITHGKVWYGMGFCGNVYNGKGLCHGMVTCGNIYLVWMSMYGVVGCVIGYDTIW